ncbi:MAG: SWIM zinc finger family protein [Candidatus Peribacter sp.]|nr:SWIM zinc finger family protein [Candidatus Peribacter sp.]
MANADTCSSKSWVKKSNSRYDCRIPNCKAQCVYKKFEEDLFVLNKFVPHTCKFERKKNARGKNTAPINAESIARRIDFLVKRNPCLSCTAIMDALEGFCPEMGIADSPRFLPGDQYKIVWRARELVRELHFGSDDDYQKLESIQQELQSIDPQTYFNFEFDRDGHYEKCFCIPGAFQRAAPFCAPIVSFDASHMKPLGRRAAVGFLYLFTLKDANGNVHVCVGHSGRETIENWKWFLKPMFDLVITPNKMALISDEHTSICPAIAEVDDSFAKWSACIVHRKGNVVKRYDKVAGELFENAAKAYTLEQYEKCKQKIKDFGPGLYQYCFGSYLDEELEVTTDERHYYRSKMEVRNHEGDLEKYYRNGITSTQTSEIMNGQPGAGRSFFGGWWRYHHPVKMIVVSYNWYMRRFAALKEQAKTFNEILTPRGEKIIKIRVEKSTNCLSTSLLETLSTTAYSRNPEIGTQVSSVHDEGENTYYEVNLRHRSCSCNMWQEWDIPCKHAVAVLKRRNISPYEFCGDMWRRGKYQEMFENMGELITVKESGYDLNPEFKPPLHGPYGTVVATMTGKEIQVCLCTMCGKKSIHKQPGPAQHARIKSSTDLASRS